jgi:hypothetical protein
MSWTTRLIPGWKLMVTGTNKGYFDVLCYTRKCNVQRRGKFRDVSVCQGVCELIRETRFSIQ